MHVFFNIEQERGNVNKTGCGFNSKDNLKTKVYQNFTWAENHLIIFNIVQKTCILGDLAKFRL